MARRRDLILDARLAQALNQAARQLCSWLCLRSHELKLEFEPKVETVRQRSCDECQRCGAEVTTYGAELCGDSDKWRVEFLGLSQLPGVWLREPNLVCAPSCA